MDSQTGSKPVVQLKNVTKTFGSRTIIDHLTLDLPSAEVFGFLGPNGAGKTTTIRMMVGLMSLTDGDVLIEGHSIRKDYEKAIRHVGAIVENPEMYKYLTGFQNLLHFSRMVPGITKQRIDEVVELVGLKSRIHDKVKTYSLGMRQRLGVAQAIMHKPSLLILDEPTNGLDPAGIRELRDYLRKLAKEEGITVFVSSHLLSEMELMCDRVAIIQGGKLIDVRSIRQGAPLASEASRVLFEVDRPAEAVLYLAKYNAIQEEDAALVNVDKETIAVVNSELVTAGFKVFGIRILNKSLEEQFLEMTGGESVV
ncbi:putative ABC transporter ATP-binding protein YhcH [Paenibacillus baekrokdamisoli]|uniref:Putative ABC transporter ATP-binding protein YhcH n=1 Tax=Paenibacillus baekrokdamisoli TaxID=1712516 RepID=A0A3G9ISK2_9BACL|nr:ABC transporter ATP-binding protein [Paenibacillus baekrokdamisoli]MBB3071671.1 ABC-2 type transport system ATP-binding protein [Paenibacillus baekrokdamisoli]BBH21820.1 putative ABC transporter ATP-binding protein YhcH [Paenibacillus baekrokdamisoli]